MLQPVELLLHWNHDEPKAKVWACEKRSRMPVTAWGKAGDITCRETQNAWESKVAEKLAKGYIDLGEFDNLANPQILHYLADAAATIADSIRSGVQIDREIRGFPASAPEMSAEWLGVVVEKLVEEARSAPADEDLHVALSTGTGFSLRTGRRWRADDIAAAKGRQRQRAEGQRERATAHITIVKVHRPAPASTLW